MKIPCKLEDFEISFLKKRGLIVTFDKYPDETEFNNSILFYCYVPIFGVFMLDDEDQKQYKLTKEDIPEFFIKDIKDDLKYRLNQLQAEILK